MYLGRIVETAATDDLFARPVHPYTRTLLPAIPASHPRMARNRQVLSGDVPSPMAIPSGCRFAPRCPFAEARCRQADPALLPSGEERSVPCHLPHAIGRASVRAKVY